MATINLVTNEDLEIFKVGLIETFKGILAESQGSPTRKWLKSHEVRRLLTVSPNTLQGLRERGLLPYTKIGGVIYYDYDDIRRMLEANKTSGPEPNPLPLRIDTESNVNRRKRS